jgi:hypothetical protein
MEQFICRFCNAQFGIVGSLDSEEDWETQNHFDEQVRYHQSRLCRHRSTPQSVLDAPTLRPQQIWPEPRRYGWRDSLAFGPYTSTKVRKIRKGRKARFNRSAS